MATRSRKPISCILIAIDIVILHTASRYVPTARHGHTSLLVGGNLYLWGGSAYGGGMPRVHDSPEKTRLLSSVDVFQVDSGDWRRQATSGTPPLGVSGYCCTAVGGSLYYYGGYCGHGFCYHNSVHKLSTSFLQWMMLSPSTSKSGAPMRKDACGMVAFRDGEEDILCVVAGWRSTESFFDPDSTPSYRQPGAQYDEEDDEIHMTCCNEHHMFSLSTSE